MKVQKVDIKEGARVSRSSATWKNAREQYYKNLSWYTKIFKARMAFNGLTQAAVGEANGVTEGLISKFLKGKRFNFPTFQYLEALPPRHLEVG